MAPFVLCEWIRVFMGMTLYSHLGMLVAFLEFAKVLGFVDVFC